MMYTTKGKCTKEGEGKRRNSNKKKKSVAAVGHARGGNTARSSFPGLHPPNQTHTSPTHTSVRTLGRGLGDARHLLLVELGGGGGSGGSHKIRRMERGGEVASSSRTKSEGYRETKAGVKRALGCRSLWVRCVRKGGMRRGRVSMGCANFGC